MIVAVDNVQILSLNPYLIRREQFYLNGGLQATTDTNLDTFDPGVYRTQLTDPNCNYDRVDVTLFKAEKSGLPYPVAWSNSSVDPAFDARTTTLFQRNNLLSGFQGAITTLSVTSGYTVKFSITVTIAGGGTGSVIFFLTEATETTNYASQTNSNIPTGTTTINVELTPSSASTRLRIRTGLSAGNTMDITMASSVSIIPLTGITETKTLDIDCACLRNNVEGYNLSWLNKLGGFDHCYFKGFSDYLLDISSTGETSVNIFPNWPNSYGEFADTKDRKQTFRDSANQILLRSQHLTQEQVDIISEVKSSTVVQIVNSIYDRRTVIVDKNSFTKRKESDKLFEISFIVTYTDNVASQRV